MRTKHRKNISSPKSKPTLIPRPQGQPGRDPKSGGYNLQVQMGLENKTEKYLKIRSHIRTLTKYHLDTEKCYRDQIKNTVAAVCRMMCQKYKSLESYEDTWPVRVIISQYLMGSKDRIKPKKNVKAAQRKQQQKSQKVQNDKAAHDAEALWDASEDDEDTLEGGDGDEEDAMDESSGNEDGGNESGGDESGDMNVRAAEELWASSDDDKSDEDDDSSAPAKEPHSSNPAKETHTQTTAQSKPKPVAKANLARATVKELKEKAGSNTKGTKEKSGAKADKKDKGKGKEKATESAVQSEDEEQEKVPKIKIPGGRQPARTSRKIIISDTENEPITPRTKSTVVHRSINLPSPLRPITPIASTSRLSPSLFRQPSEGSDFADVLKEVTAADDDEEKQRDPLTVICPHMGCQDIIPDSPSSNLKLLLTTRRKFLEKGAVDGKLFKLSEFNYEICQAIKSLKLATIANASGWPTTFDPAVLSATIDDLYPVLKTIVRDPFSTSLVLQRLQSIMPLDKIAHFWEKNRSSVALIPVCEDIRVGYFGEQGQAVILSHLELQFPPWILDEYTEEFAPLSPDAFRHLVLCPSAALMAISHLQGTDTKKAYVMMRESSDYGYSRFQMDDQESGTATATSNILIINRRKLRDLKCHGINQLSGQLARDKAAEEAATALINVKPFSPPLADVKTTTRATRASTRKRQDAPQAQPQPPAIPATAAGAVPKATPTSSQAAARSRKRGAHILSLEDFPPPQAPPAKKARVTDAGTQRKRNAAAKADKKTKDKNMQDKDKLALKAANIKKKKAT